MNSLPACYLVGFLLGKRSIEKGTNSGILYTGKDAFTSRIAASLKGLRDAGFNIPLSNDILPMDDRIIGNHIANYAKILKDDQEKYKSRFSLLLRAGLEPEDYPSHFEAVKKRISLGEIHNDDAQINVAEMSQS
jgi:large subunit ribosomal protein L18